MENVNRLCLSCSKQCKQQALAIVIECPHYDYNGSTLPRDDMVELMSRELTADEKRAIRELVTKKCANYCSTYKECLPLDSSCYMLNMHYFDDNLCKYFKSSVLPLDTVLEQSLYSPTSNIKPCAVCGTGFLVNGKVKYCSENCKIVGTRKRDMLYKRKQRQNKG